MAAAKNVLESAREVVQDILVPELKAIRVSVDSLRTEMKLSQDAIREEMRLRHETLEHLIRSGDERNELLLRSFAEKMDYAVEFRERLAVMEARLPKM